MPFQHLAIFGAGSIGCHLGGHVFQAGLSARLLVRQRIEDTLREHGLTLSHYADDSHHIPWSQVDATQDPAEALDGADLIFLTVKSQDTEAAAETLAAHAKPGAVLVSFQNGVSNADRLRALLPELHVLGGMVPYNILHDPPGTFHCGTEGHILVEGDAQGQKVEQFLRPTLLDVEAHPRLPEVMWTKLLMNLNNAVNALAGVPLKQELSNPTYRKVLAACIEEGLELYKRAGIQPVRVGKVIPAMLPWVLRRPNWMFIRIASSMLQIDPQARSSMWDDLRLGRRTEIDFINGELVALAHKHGHRAPANQAIIGLIREAEAAGQGSPEIPADALWRQIEAARKGEEVR